MKLQIHGNSAVHFAATVDKNVGHPDVGFLKEGKEVESGTEPVSRVRGDTVLHRVIHRRPTPSHRRRRQ